MREMNVGLMHVTCLKKAFRMYCSVVCVLVVVVLCASMFLSCGARQPSASQEQLSPTALNEDSRSFYHGNDERYVYAGLPRCSRPLLVLTNSAYRAGYDEERKNPAWVGYRIPGDEKFGNYTRVSWFSVDRRTRARVSYRDYTNSGYTRGHLAPSYAIFTRFGKEAQKETYMMSNICPQYRGFNLGIWKKLELDIARPKGWAEKCKELWILAGPIYDEENNCLPCGVEIPDGYYKIVLDVVEESNEPRVLPFLFPHKKSIKKPLPSFLTNVDTIEQKTGLDFFRHLDDARENNLESKTPQKIWTFN